MLRYNALDKVNESVEEAERMPDGLPAVLTVREVASWLRVSEQTVMRELHQGALVGFRVRGAWRVRNQALDAYIEGEPPAAPSSDDELSTQQVAQLIGRARETAWRLMSSGAITSTRRGRTWTTTRRAVEDYLATGGASTEAP